MGDYKNVACYVARCQPFHSGHRQIIDTLLAKGKRVVVALYDTSPDERNPLSPYERTKIIKRIYGDRVEVVVIPAFGILVYGRGVGYEFREFPDLGGSAGEIRESHRVIWLTGQSGAGKTTLAQALRPMLRAIVLDGDEMRRSISTEIGYTLDERMKHAKRQARLARELSRQQNVIVASIGATAEIRAAVDEIVAPIWVYVEREQPEREGYPYEPPISPDVIVDCDALSEMAVVEYVWAELLRIIFQEDLEEEGTYVHV